MDQKNQILDNSYLLEETLSEPDHESKNTGRHSTETLVWVRTDLAKYYRLNQKLQSINRFSDGKHIDSTVSQLNGLLKSNGIGGVNGGTESKAYFTVRGKEVVLVANTIANGEEISSRKAIYEAFARIDELVSDPFSKTLSRLEAQMGEMHHNYQSSTNDVFRVMDTAVNAFGGEGGNAIYQRAIDKVRAETAPHAGRFESRYFERMNSLRPKIEAKNLSLQELAEVRLLESQKRRFDALMGMKLQTPEWITKDVAVFLWDTKGNMVDYAVEWAKWVWTGMVLAFIAPIIFGYWFATDERVRKAVSEAIGNFPTQMAELMKNPDKFKAMIAKEANRIGSLPADQQAFEIGKIAGWICGDAAFGLAFAKMLWYVFKSSTLRLAMTPESKAAAAGTTLEWSTTARGMMKLSSVHTWDDFASFVSQIDHIRFRRWWDARRILSVADDIRSGKAKISDMPNIAGLRDKVAELMHHRGLIPEKKGVIWKVRKVAEENLFDLGVEGTKAILDKIAKILPNRKAANLAEALSESHTKGLKLYDRFDEHITNLRAAVSDAPSWLGHHSREFLAAGYQKISDQAKEILSHLGMSWSGNGALQATLVSIRDTFDQLYQTVGWDALREKMVSTVSETIARTKEWVNQTISTLQTPIGKVNRLTPAQMNEAVFSHGIWAAKIKLPNGKEVFRLVDTEGKFLLDPRKAPMDFDVLPSFRSDGTAIVAIDGKYGMIDRRGIRIINLEFESLQDLGSTRKIAKKDGEFFLIERDTNGNWKRSSSESFAFMTEPQEGVAIWIRQENGKMVRHVVREDGISQPLLKKFDFVDDFTEEGVAAVRYRDPKKGDLWAVIDREGQYVSFVDPKTKKKEIFRNISASNAAEVIERYRHESVLKSELVNQLSNSALFKDAKKLALRHGMKAERVAPTNVKGIFTVMENGKKWYINANTNIILKAEFDEIIAHDAGNWFLRVKKNGKWGILDSETGKPHFDYESRGYASIQLQSAKDDLFEVEIPWVNAKGETVMKRGLIGRHGNIHIEPKYDYIESPSPGVYRWVVYEYNGRNFRISESSEFVHVWNEVSTVANAKFDAASAVTTIAKNANYARSANESVQSLNVRTMSRAVEEIRAAGLSRIMRGLDGLHGVEFPTFNEYIGKMGVDTSIGKVSVPLFESYLRGLFSAYRKAYQANVSPLSKKESFFLETQVFQDYVRDFQKKIASQWSPSSFFGGFKLNPTKNLFNATEPAANDSIFFRNYGQVKLGT